MQSSSKNTRSFPKFCAEKVSLTIKKTQVNSREPIIWRVKKEKINNNTQTHAKDGRRMRSIEWDSLRTRFIGDINSSFAPNSTWLLRFCMTFAIKIKFRLDESVLSMRFNASGVVIAGVMNRRKQSPPIIESTYS